MPFEKRDQTSGLLSKITPLFAILLFVGVSAGIYFLVIQSEIQNFLPGGPLDVEVKRQVVESRKKYLADLQGLDSLYQQYGSGEMSKISTILPNEKGIPSLFSSYEKMARNLGVGLQSIDIVSQDGKVKNLPGVRELLISLKFTNVDYMKFKQLLKTLEANARFTDVVSFDIQPEAQFATVNIKTYYFTDK